MSAFYLPVLLMLAGLILRGVSFEFRHKTERMRWIWNASFAGGRSLRRSCKASWWAPWWKACRSPTVITLAAK
jgi:hypothetical protein